MRWDLHCFKPWQEYWCCWKLDLFNLNMHNNLFQTSCCEYHSFPAQHFPVQEWVCESFYLTQFVSLHNLIPNTWESRSMWTRAESTYFQLHLFITAANISDEVLFFFFFFSFQLFKNTECVHHKLQTPTNLSGRFPLYTANSITPEIEDGSETVW